MRVFIGLTPCDGLNGGNGLRCGDLGIQPRQLFLTAYDPRFPVQSHLLNLRCCVGHKRPSTHIIHRPKWCSPPTWEIRQKRGNNRRRQVMLINRCGRVGVGAA